MKWAKEKQGLETRATHHLLGEGVDAGKAALGDDEALELVRLLVKHLLLRGDHRRDRARAGPGARLDEGSGRRLEGDELHSPTGRLGIRLPPPPLPSSTSRLEEAGTAVGVRVWRWAATAEEEEADGDATEMGWKELRSGGRTFFPFPF
jgi:hypothetical protein